jgi:hypothetical protein
MTPDQTHRLLIAPELIVLDLADAALLALDHALHLEHPLVDASPSDDDPLIRRRARAILQPAAALRRALRAYRRTADRIILRKSQRNDLPF